MKINSHQTAVDTVQPSRKAAAESPPVAKRPPSSGDRVTLSPQARELREARRALEALPDVREDKVADIRARIAAGTYRIDAAAIADKMIRDQFSDD